MDTHATHDVENQPTAFEDVDLFASDRALREGLVAGGAGWAVPRLERFGALAGSAGFQALGRQANRFPPELRTHDRFGHRIDEVEFHPAWHEVMRTGHGARAFTTCPGASRAPGAHVARSALHSLLSQVESGSCCPITMTFACRPAGPATSRTIAAAWEPGLLGTEYDPVCARVAEKPGRAGRHGDDREAGRQRRARRTQTRATCQVRRRWARSPLSTC